MSTSFSEKPLREEAGADVPPAPGSGLGERILHQSSLYAIGNIAIKAGGLLLALLYLNPEYLSVEEFGYYGLLMATAQLAIFVVGLGLSTGLLKHLTDSAYAAEHAELPATAFTATAASIAIWLTFAFLFAEPVAGLLLDDPRRAPLFQFLAGYVAFKVLAQPALTVLRVQEKAGFYALALIGEMAVLVVCAYALLAGAALRLTGLLAAHTVAAGVSAIVLLVLVLRRVAWRPDRRMISLLIRFGVPLVMASLSAWLLNVGDRYIIKAVLDARAVALYEWAARVAGVLQLLLVNSFFQAFTVIGLKALDGEGHAALHRTTFRHYTAWAGWAVLGLALSAYDLTRLLPADPAYLQSSDLVLLLSLGFMAYGAYYIVVNVMYGSGRTGMISLNVLGAALLNVGLNVLLVPRLGINGAAITTLVSYLVLALGAAFFARQDHAIRFEWHVLFMAGALAAGLYVLGRPSLAWETQARLAFRGGLLLIYPIILVLTGLYRRSDARQAFILLQKMLRRAARVG